MDTKIRLTSYQLESSVRTKQYTLTERILEQYKALLDEQYEINQEKGDVLLLEREEYSSIIRNNTDLMLNLVNDVLDLSRMETGDLHLFQLAPDREKVCIAVTDTGAGIPLEKQAAVFNRFEKLDDYKPGAGLGLSICLLIAERLNGSLSIDSSIYNPQIEE